MFPLHSILILVRFSEQIVIIPKSQKILFHACKINTINTLQILKYKNFHWFCTFYQILQNISSFRDLNTKFNKIFAHFTHISSFSIIVLTPKLKNVFFLYFEIRGPKSTLVQKWVFSQKVTQSSNYTEILYNSSIFCAQCCNKI